MNRFLIIILIILIIIIGIQFKQARELKYQIHQQQQDIEASSLYINKLTKKLNSVQQPQSLSKEERLTNLLQDYLSEQKTADSVSNTTLPEQASKENRKQNYIPDIVPINGEYIVSQDFSEQHTALDFAAPLGTEVIAAASGEVLSVYEDRYFGNVIMIDHLNQYATLYAHLAKTLVTPGSFVKKGETIGLVGDTGNSTGPHLHFEIMVDGKNQNPTEILNN